MESTAPQDIILFGNGRWAEFLWEVFLHDSRFRVCAFTADRAYIEKDELCGLPVVAFETVAQTYPPERFLMHVGVGFVDQNRVRAAKVAAAKALGYRLVSHTSSRASVWPDLDLGENCMIHEGAIVQPFVKVGDDTQVLSNANVSHHTQIGKHCFIAGSATIGGSVIIGDNCFVGMGAVIRDSVTVAANVPLAAGAVLVSDATEPGCYMGVPAKLVAKD